MDLRRSIVQHYHDAPTAGHPGELTTFVAVAMDYWWPGMRTFIRQYVAGCAPCQQFKINRRPTKPALVPIPSSSSRPFAQCSMDFITDLPEINGFNAILSVVDHGLMKGAIFIPCSKSIDSEQTAQILVDRLFSRFGLSDSFLSDRGPQFASRTTKEYFRLLGIKTNLSTTFHPQTDGMTERYNQEIEAYLSIYCINNPTEWVKYLPILEYTHNNRRHADRQQLPFELMYGYSPRSFPLTFDKTEFPHLDDRLQSLEQARQEALAAHEIARSRMAGRINGTFDHFKSGQKVWLEARNLKLGYNKKISTKREGPFLIKEKLGPVTYRLRLPKTWKIL
jgi:hypothetical protein